MSSHKQLSVSLNTSSNSFQILTMTWNIKIVFNTITASLKTTDLIYSLTYTKKKKRSKQYQYLGKWSSQLWIQFSPDLHERHGSKLCSMGGVKYTHTHTLLLHLESLNATASSMCWYSPYSWCTSLALSQFLSGSTHTSASRAGRLWPMSSRTQTLLLSQTETQATKMCFLLHQDGQVFA